MFGKISTKNAFMEPPEPHGIQAAVGGGGGARSPDRRLNEYSFNQRRRIENHLIQFARRTLIKRSSQLVALNNRKTEMKTLRSGGGGGVTGYQIICIHISAGNNRFSKVAYAATLIRVYYGNGRYRISQGLFILSPTPNNVINILLPHLHNN
jgi:hypothetical protein